MNQHFRTAEEIKGLFWKHYQPCQALQRGLLGLPVGDVSQYQEYRCSTHDATEARVIEMARRVSHHPNRLLAIRGIHEEDAHFFGNWLPQIKVEFDEGAWHVVVFMPAIGLKSRKESRDSQ